MIEQAFEALSAYTAPKVPRSGGCFPAGTVVQTPKGPRAIEAIAAGTEVYSWNLATGRWVVEQVVEPLSHAYVGDMISVQFGALEVQATGNHPFYVMSGERLEARPPAEDVPAVERNASGSGRWVEARDLLPGDVLVSRAGDLVVTGTTSRRADTTVHNLSVGGGHNYAVSGAGILVHNKGGAESAQEVSESLDVLDVTVHQTLDLEHYHVNVLSSTGANSLRNWLVVNGYAVDATNEEVLESYIERGWSFVAIKLQPEEIRRYDREFLPPVVISFESDELVYPLLISSISTVGRVRLSLYVIAESTVVSSNYPTRDLRFGTDIPSHWDLEEYVERQIRRTVGESERGFAVLWKGPLSAEDVAYGFIKRTRYEAYRAGDIEMGDYWVDWDSVDAPAREAMSELGWPWTREPHLTRLEARMGPEAMTEDVYFALDPDPRSLEVRLWKSPRFLSLAVRLEPVWCSGGESVSRGLATRAALSLHYAGHNVVPFYNVDLVYAKGFGSGPGVQSVGIEAGANFVLLAPSATITWQATDTGVTPYLGLTIRGIEVPPMLSPIDIGLSVLPVSVRWNLQTGERIWSIGLGSISVGPVMEWASRPARGKADAE